MTPPTDIGKEPPRDQMLVDCWSDHEVIEYVQMVRADYADYWRRRALAAEGLLREAWKNQYLVEWEARVAQHFAGAEGEK